MFFSMSFKGYLNSLQKFNGLLLQVNYTDIPIIHVKLHTRYCSPFNQKNYSVIRKIPT